MIIGAHMMIQSSSGAEDKKFFSEVLGLPSIDAGDGFLLYAVPTSEIAIHEGSGGAHELFLMCEDAEEFVAQMKRRGLSITDPQNHGWGIMSDLTLPGGGTLRVYQPLHKRPKAAAGRGGARKRKARKAAKASRSSAERRTKSKAAKQRRGRARRK